MTEDEIIFVKEVKLGADALVQTISTTTTRPTDFVFQAQQDAFIKLRLIALLVRVEAMREKANFWNSHKRTDVLGDCIACENCGRVHTLDERHNWSDADWIRAVRERWGI